MNVRNLDRIDKAMEKITYTRENVAANVYMRDKYFNGDEIFFVLFKQNKM